MQNRVFVSREFYDQTVSRISYFVAWIGLALLVVFFIQSFRLRPVIHEIDLINKIITTDDLSKWHYVQRNGNFVPDIRTMNYEKMGLYFEIEPDAMRGFTIDREAISFPDEAERMLIVIELLYMGSPEFHYGFLHDDMKQVQDKPLATTVTLRSSIEEWRYTILNSGTSIQKETIAISWDGADSFYFFMSANVSSKLYLMKMSFVETK